METHPLNELPKLQEFLNNMPNGWQLYESEMSLLICEQLIDFGYLQEMRTPVFQLGVKTRYIVNYRKMQQSLF